MKFDWIDFGSSGNEPRDEPVVVDPLLHNSTSSLLAQLLRGRDAPYRKVFCWLRRQEDVVELSDTPGVRHVEATFPFRRYMTATNTDRLVIFADWLVNTTAVGAPELGLDPVEGEALKQRLSVNDFTYSRTDRLKSRPGQPRCEIVYRHTPNDLTIVATCKLPGGDTLTRTLEAHPFRRDELVYGRAVTGCVFREDGELALETHLGLL